MKRIEAELVSFDRELRELVGIEFEDDEWIVVNEFHANSERLRSTRFVQKGDGGQIAVSWNRETGISCVKSTMRPLIDTFWVFVLI